MGITHISGKVEGPKGSKTVKFLVDSGATYSLLPFEVWQIIGVKPKRSMDFSLADGTPVHRDISECRFILDEGEGYSPVVLGHKGDAALLGVVTLENLGLVFNPFNRTLRPMKMLLT